MTGLTDIDDTRKLPVLRERVRLIEAGGGSDTNKIDLAQPAATEAGWTATNAPHPFASGIIRFYRARTILHQDSDRGQQAWRYLEPLMPADLPPSARKEFIDLVCFMQEQKTAGRLDIKAFGRKIRSIAAHIDCFVDELAARFDRCNGRADG
jgi:hypothetical protein